MLKVEGELGGRDEVEGSVEGGRAVGRDEVEGSVESWEGGTR